LLLIDKIYIEPPSKKISYDYLISVANSHCFITLVSIYFHYPHISALSQWNSNCPSFLTGSTAQKESTLWTGCSFWISF
jgi:hypothetical protein